MASISPRWVGRVYSSVDFDVNHYEIKIEEEYTEGAQQTQERAAPSRLCMLHDNTLLEVSFNSTKSGRQGLSDSVTDTVSVFISSFVVNRGCEIF